MTTPYSGAPLGGEAHMTLTDILKLTRRWVGFLLVAALVGGGLAYALVRLSPVTYTATATAYVHVEPSTTEQGGSSAQYAAEQLAISQAESLVPVMTSPTVAQAVADSLGLDTSPAALADALTATHTADTHTLVITARADSAALARRIADEVITQTAAELENLEGTPAPAQVLLMSSAELADVSRSPSTARAVATGAVGAPVATYAVLLLAAASGRRNRKSTDRAHPDQETARSADVVRRP
ncbi:hypothetical protein [Actinomyces sp. MRS3W]|uniref:YveK family protein n=1 Tax=Actinomyces sp. MRS3W TaxID=2800796 RepID=UPI0028FD082A|nr:hypothetical protein [Actinomyces sp. MRS3W]MDU0349610.1 hypothetical protein [Actinomyces sp. MRS3W]